MRLCLRIFAAIDLLDSDALRYVVCLRVAFYWGDIAGVRWSYTGYLLLALTG